ncbi:MAG TPA: hypothetical protein PLI31_05180, partial [Methanoregulaceae archaeon]|nr:hypothetical protein [Methanoregulaceae archaeon]
MDPGETGTDPCSMDLNTDLGRECASIHYPSTTIESLPDRHVDLSRPWEGEDRDTRAFRLQTGGLDGRSEPSVS